MSAEVVVIADAENMRVAESSAAAPLGGETTNAAALLI